MRLRLNRPRLFVSVSGGRTSMFMALILWFAFRDTHELVFIFANTGQEHEETLRFVKRCQDTWGLEIVWVEAVVDPRKGVGTSFKIVNFETASRRGEPFRAVIAKYGIPNSAFPHCNRELKLNPMYAYLASIGWERGTYNVAVGIRADEADRASVSATARGILYPLIEWGFTKEDILAWWLTQPFNLYLPEHLGNCKWCWKKTDRKLLTLMVDFPEVFGFPEEMEELYATAGAGIEVSGPRRFFRKKRTVEELRALAAQPFQKFVDGNHVFDPELDVGGGCGGGESCDIHADDTDASDAQPWLETV